MCAGYIVPWFIYADKICNDTQPLEMGVVAWVHLAKRFNILLTLKIRYGLSLSKHTSASAGCVRMACSSLLSCALIWFTFVFWIPWPVGSFSRDRSQFWKMFWCVIKFRCSLAMFPLANASPWRLEFVEDLLLRGWLRMLDDCDPYPIELI